MEISFNDYWKEVIGKVQNPRRYGLIVDVVNMAREAHKTGGFEAVAVQLEEYRDKNRCRIATEALIRECDNWRYAFKDLNTAIQVARVYSGQ